MVIVVPDEPWRRALTALFSEHRTLGDLHFELAGGHPELVLQQVRSRHGAAPVAFVAQSELEALDAIEAGADEALALSLESAAQAIALVERAARRAARRLALEHSRTLAARAEKLTALETVVAAVAHEINNPLAAVSLSIEYLRGKLPASVDAPERAADYRRVLDDVLDMVDSMAAIVRDLRSYARAEQEDVLEWVDVPELVEQVLRMMGSELSATALIERDFALDLPRVCVPRSRIAQVLTNLLVNAMHAMREVERTVHRVRISVGADADAVAISITDTGVGIAPEALGRIFEPYFTTKGEGRGTGLGLSISRSILLRIGGDLLVESVHGDGATFILLIPRVQREAQDRGRRALEPTLVTAGRRPALMVVEDDQRLLRIYPRLLRDHFDLITAADGQEAIDLLRSGVHIDAIVSDVNMPVVDGEGLYRWIAEHRPRLLERTLFVTGAQDRQRHHFLASIANPVLEKPITSDALISAIHALLFRKPGRETTAYLPRGPS